jgi:hypothetical protein
MYEACRGMQARCPELRPLSNYDIRIRANSRNVRYLPQLSVSILDPERTILQRTQYLCKVTPEALESVLEDLQVSM